MRDIDHPNHDHQACISRTLAAAEALGKYRIRLTALRRRVLEIMLEKHVAIGAYDILKRLDSEGLSSQPPVAYRILQFWIKHGFAHKIEKMSAFVACTYPNTAHTPAFLICGYCKLVTESAPHHVQQQLDTQAVAQDFEIEHTVIEAVGVCARCKKEKHFL